MMQQQKSIKHEPIQDQNKASVEFSITKNVLIYFVRHIYIYYPMNLGSEQVVGNVNG